MERAEEFKGPRAEKKKRNEISTGQKKKTTATSNLSDTART